MSHIHDLEADILQVLAEAGTEGLSVRKVARHVYNARHTMFDDLDYGSLHASVSRYLRYHADSKKSIIIHSAKRGHYTLDPKKPLVTQLKINFED